MTIQVNTMRLSFAIFSTILIVAELCSATDKDFDVQVFTVASEETEGYLRYIRSATYYNIDVTTLGLNQEWRGGKMDSYGGGYKINLLRSAIEPFRDDTKKIILFTDSYDVLFTSSLEVIVRKFKKINARIVFGAEKYLWPDETLEGVYPNVAKDLPKYLNSGLFMGYASDLYELLQAPIKDKDDDQVYYTKLFLNEALRKRLQIQLDYQSEIFQNLNGASADVRLFYNDGTGEFYVKNVFTESTPNLLHGNGPSKILLNNFGSYVAGAFKHEECQLCDENKLDEFTDPKDFPIVTIGIFITNPTPFLQEYFDSILALEYPKDKLHIFLYNNVEYHQDLATKFWETYRDDYISFKQITFNDKFIESVARNLAVNYAEEVKADYLFVVDAEAHIDKEKALIELIRQNRNFIAPLLTRHKSTWSNFWGALSELGFYARSHDYMHIVNNKRRGIWNVPFVSSCYLIKRSVFPKITYADDNLDSDMALCKHLRKEQIFMHLYNMEQLGHLVNGDTFNPLLTRPEFYELTTNQHDWENRYIHREYYEQLEPNKTHKQPCQDVYWFPIASDHFADDLVEIVEAYGKWSDGSNSDERLQGGYEAVPTRDIHMNQVGLEKTWLAFLKEYVRPLQEAVFTQYYHNPPRSLMNFVVRYRPDEQPSLRPHHDSSTYTINIALNQFDKDYEGGGCRFWRYNCSVTATQKGWMLMHPGRLTHLHEGLPTTKGTRYIMVSFVDP